MSNDSPFSEIPETEAGPGPDGAEDDALSSGGPIASAAEPMRLEVESRGHGWRVDHYLARLYPNYSRALFQKAVEQKAVQVNGIAVKSSRRLRVSDIIEFRLPSLPDLTIPPEDIPVDVLYEDDWIIVLNKQAGIITHPGRGNYTGTLAGALQFHFDRLSDIAGKLRPGIVHRLDRDSSGVLVVAKDNTVHHRLTAQFEAREVRKEYRAICWGELNLDRDTIVTHMRVHPHVREKMAVCEPGGNSREAVTGYEVLERFRGFTFVRLMPKTGRTHQLRVHMQHLANPIVADRAYGGRNELRLAELKPHRPCAGDSSKPHRPCAGGEMTDGLPAPRTAPIADSAETTSASDLLIARQALHAYRLEFRHPETGKPLTFEAPWPDDMQRTLEALREHR